MMYGNERRTERRFKKSVKAVSFLKDITGKLKRTNDYSGIGAAVRSMIDGGKVKMDFPSDEYLTRDEDDTDTD